MNVEDTLRDALEAEARAATPEPSEATWRSIERRAARRRAARWAGTSAVAAAAAVVAVVLLLPDSQPTRVDVVPADPTTTTSTTIPSRLVGRSVFTIGSDDPLETTRRFGLDYLGMTSPDVERQDPFEGAEIVLLRPRAGHPMTTKVVLERDADGSFVIIRVFTSRIMVERPEEGDQIGTRLQVAGMSTAFEGTVRVQVRQSDGRILADTFVTGGASGELDLFTGDFTFEAPTTDTGAVVFFTESAEDGSVQEATVVPVVFAS
jgi:hypothetical protein